MSKRISRSGSVIRIGLDVHLVDFLATLAEAGYVVTTRQDKRREIGPFVRWVQDARITIDELDEARIDMFLARRPRRRRKYRDRYARGYLLQFLEHLRIVGLVPPRQSEPSSAEVILRRYLDHLRDVRGLSPRSMEIYAPLAQRLPETISALNASAIRSHLLSHGRTRSVPFVKLLAAALRSFLRFCFLVGETATDLSTAVPPVRRWQAAPLPPFLAAEEVEQVLAATDRSTPRGRRAVAILLLLARSRPSGTYARQSSS